MLRAFIAYFRGERPPSRDTTRCATPGATAILTMILILRQTPLASHEPHAPPSQYQLPPLPCLEFQRFKSDLRLLELDYKDDPDDLHTLFYLGG